jgi:hypothetical protein
VTAWNLLKLQQNALTLHRSETTNEPVLPVAAIGLALAALVICDARQ